jgi:hypothetical protein
MKYYNKRPWNFVYSGGKVRRTKRMTKAQLSHDSVRAILMPGEIVIPTKYAKRVALMLKRSNIHLPGL